MKEFIEKLIARLEELKASGNPYDSYWDEAMYRATELVNSTSNKTIDGVIEIVNEFAGQYNNGWIPCSERLPDIEHISGVSETVLVTTNNNSIFTAEYHGNGKWLDDVADWSLEVIAWQPLPEPYKENENGKI